MNAEEFFNAYSPQGYEICTHLRNLVRSVLPEAEEIVFTGWKNVSYGTGDSHADKDLICYIAPFSQSVYLGFFRGALLEDRDGLLGGTGKFLRHVKIKRKDEFSDEQLKWLLQAAWNERVSVRR